MSEVRRSWITPVVVAGSAVVLLAVSWSTWPSVVDDAYISARYAAQLAAGNGLTYNAGAPWVEGFSNPLWTILLGGLLALRVPVLAAMTGLGFVFALLSLPLAVGLTRRLAGTDAPPTALPALLMALSPHLAVSATNGLESSMMLCLVLASLWAHLSFERGRWRAGVLAGALAWTRPEAFAITGLVALHDLWQHRDRPARAVVAWVGGGLTVLLFVLRRLLYGEWLPNTYHAKSSFPITETFEVNAQYLTPERWTLGAALVVWALGLALAPRRGLAFFVGGVALVLAGMQLTVNLWMPGLRYFLAPMAIAACMLAAAIARMPRVPSALATFAAVLGMVGFLANDGDRVRGYDGRHTVQPGNGAQRAAEHLAAHLPAGSVLATRDAGVLAYFVGTDVTVAELHQRALTQPHPDGKDHDVRANTPVDPEAFISTVQREHVTELAYGNDRKIFSRFTQPYAYLGRVEQHYHRYYDVYVRADLGVPELPPEIVVNRNGPLPKVVGEARVVPAGALPDTGE